MLYLTKDLFPVFVPLGIIGFYRYLWFAIKLLAYFFYRPMQPKENPTYRAEYDVTIIVPTIDAGEEFKEAAHSWLVNNPKEIIIITETKMKDALQELANSVDPTRIRVLTVPKANKRLQMVEGIRNATSEIIVFADDDAIWGPNTLEYILACFEDPNMGGVGTSQTVKSVGRYQTVWEVLAGFRLTIRNIEIAASTHIDGGVCCLSGRTAAYRTCILQDPQFQYNFTHDFWLGKYPLNSGDDKFLTRWMVYHGWNTYIQVCKEAELLSTFKNNWRFVKQVLRWTRNTWRSDFRSLFTERKIWSRHPYVAFTMIDKIFNPITLLSGPISVTVMAAKGEFHLPLWDIIISYIVWLMLTRIVKLLPHLFKRPQDIIWVPAFLIFGYYFAIMKIYALFTLHEVGWGTRAGIDQTPAEAAADKEKQRLDAEQELNDREKAAYESRDEATRAAVAAATAAAAATAYEQQQQQQQQQQRMEHPVIPPPRPDSPGSNDLIRHFSRQQEQQRQTAAARASRLANTHTNNAYDDEDDEDVYEYNQDDELAQYFAQADAALSNLNLSQQQHPNVIYGGAGGPSTIDLYGRSGGGAAPPPSAPTSPRTGPHGGRGGYY
jgi:cellulose synthase/poly-beta-1,6-N-acetylglucosamine synthase-like glycosyltransferase